MERILCIVHDHMLTLHCTGTRQPCISTSDDQGTGINILSEKRPQSLHMRAYEVSSERLPSAGSIKMLMSSIHII